MWRACLRVVTAGGSKKLRFFGGKELVENSTGSHVARVLARCGRRGLEKLCFFGGGKLAGNVHWRPLGARVGAL